MTLALDLAIVAIVALCVWRGFRAGMINGICGILAVAIALYGGSIVSRVYSGMFTEMIEPFMSGFVDKAMSSVLMWQEDGRADPPEIVLTEAERLQPEKVAYAVYYQLGFSQDVSAKMAGETGAAVDNTGQSLIADITDRIDARLAYLAVFYIVFALIAIVFFAIGNVLDLSFGLPGLENVNHITGALLGAVKGILIVLILACAFRYLGVIVGRETIAKTWLLRRLLENNLAANILGL